MEKDIHHTRGQILSIPHVCTLGDWIAPVAEYKSKLVIIVSLAAFTQGRPHIASECFIAFTAEAQCDDLLEGCKCHADSIVVDNLGSLRIAIGR